MNGVRSLFSNGSSACSIAVADPDAKSAYVGPSRFCDGFERRFQSALRLSCTAAWMSATTAALPGSAAAVVVDGVVLWPPLPPQATTTTGSARSTETSRRTGQS